MAYKSPADSKFLPFQFPPFRRVPRSTSWWAPVWRGLVVEPSGKHYRAMDRTRVHESALWTADRKVGSRLLQRLISAASAKLLRQDDMKVFVIFFLDPSTTPRILNVIRSTPTRRVKLGRLVGRVRVRIQ